MRAVQKLSSHLISVCKEFVDNLMENIKFAKTYEMVAQSTFLNRDEPAIFLKQNPYLL